jgi:hypothetical protein
MRINGNPARLNRSLIVASFQSQLQQSLRPRTSRSDAPATDRAQRPPYCAGRCPMGRDVRPVARTHQRTPLSYGGAFCCGSSNPQSEGNRQAHCINRAAGGWFRPGGIRFRAGRGLYSRPRCLPFCVSSSRACRHLPIARRPAPTGFMKLSTTAIALWPGECALRRILARVTWRTIAG